MRMRISCLLATTVLLSSAYGCKGRKNRDDLKISQGKQVEHIHMYPAVVRVQAAIVDQKGVRYTNCSGVWVSDQVVLTAESCVTDPTLGKLNLVWITAGSMSGAQSQPLKIIRQSEVDPTIVPIAEIQPKPLGLAALLYKKGMSTYHVPLAANGLAADAMVRIIGYGDLEITDSDKANQKSEGTNQVVATAPFIEIQSAQDGKEQGKSLAVGGDMGSPMFDKDNNLQAIAVDFGKRKDDPTIRFNRYVNLRAGKGLDFLNAVAKQHSVNIRNLVPGQDSLAQAPGGNLEVRPSSIDMRQPRPTPIPQPTPNPAPNTPQSGGMRGSDLNKALTFARQTQQNVIVKFSATWCGPCQQMSYTINNTPNIQTALQNRIFVEIDVDQQPSVYASYGSGSIPKTMVLNPEGRIINTATGQLDANGFLKLIR